MSTERQQNAASLSRVVAIFACVFLIACTCFSSGCSDAKVKEPAEKKEVVRELNIQPDAGAEATPSEGSAAKEPAKKPEDEIESLPFDPPEGQTPKEEKELPLLGE